MKQCIRPVSKTAIATDMLPSLNPVAIAMGSLAIATGAILMAPTAVHAQAAYGSYIGVGASFGLTEGDERAGEDQTNAAVVSFRYNILRAPISVRAQLLTFSDATAFVPTVSYDIPISWQADAYIGAGVAFQDGGSDNGTSPIGNQTAFVLQPGVDYYFPYSNMVVYGNAIIAFDAYEEGGDTATSLQTGVGIRF
jgi:hypothetical protein